MIFAYDISGVFTSHRVPQGQTVNKEYYEYFLRHILHPAICCKQPELLEATLLILQDKATCHKTNNAQAVFTEYNWEVLQHPPYSLDLSHYGYNLFPKIKELLRGIHYDDLDELYAAVNGVLRRELP